MVTIKKAVIPCAGLGTRFLPYTKNMPKELLPIVDTPVLEYIVREVVEAGITDILIIDNKNKKAIEGYFAEDKPLEDFLKSRGADKFAKIVSQTSKIANFTFTAQEVPTGSAHAIALCKDWACGEPFALLFGDDLVKSDKGDPAIGQLCEMYQKHQKTVIGCQEVSLDVIDKYSSVEISKTHECGGFDIAKIVEKPKKEEAPSNIAGLGRYVLSPEVFDYIDKTPVGAGGEYQLTDTFGLMASDGKLCGMNYRGRRYDTGNKASYLEAVVDFALESPEYAKDFASYIKKIAKTL